MSIWYSEHVPQTIDLHGKEPFTECSSLHLVRDYKEYSWIDLQSLGLPSHLLHLDFEIVVQDSTNKFVKDKHNHQLPQI